MSLKDIAKTADVSISTVSRILNNPNTSSASSETKQKVREIAKQMGYIPNQAARTLKKPDVPTPLQSIYCLIATPPDETKDDLFYSTLTASIESEAYKQNYSMGYTFSSTDFDQKHILEIMQNNAAKGLIILGRFRPELLNKLRKYFKHLIYISLNNIDVKCDGIICDGYKVARDAVRYLHESGHRKIGFIGTPNDSRLNGYLDALDQLGLKYSPDYIIDDISLSMDGGYHGMLRLLDKTRELTAVFCANDMVSIGALRACKESGILIPDNLSIIGMNNIETIQYVSPMLSSVHVPLEEMGKMATKILIDSINKGHSVPIKIFFPYYIVKRESCKKLED